MASTNPPKTDFLDKVKLSPAKLTYHSDSIRFNIEGEIPILSILTPKSPRLFLEFSIHEKKIDLGEINLEKELSAYTYKKSFSLHYEPWMEGAQLELKFFYGKKQDLTPNQSKIIARGVITTPLMVKVGQILPNEPIPDVGMYMTTDLLEEFIPQNENFIFSFPLAESDFEETAKNKEALSSLRDFLSENPQIQSFKITGVQSPEVEEKEIDSLGRNRANTMFHLFSSLGWIKTDPTISVKSRRNDWFDFRLLLKEYIEISNQKRDELYDILSDGEPYSSQETRLNQVSGFSTISNDLYPLLRVVKVEVFAIPGDSLNQKDRQTIRSTWLTNEVHANLSFMELALEAENTSKLEDKELIYVEMTKKFNSSLPFNNLAVVKMQQAQRVLNQNQKEKLWSQAKNLFNQGSEIEPSPYFLHNLGQIQILEGDYSSAYKSLSDASVMTKEKDFLRINENLRGALDIIRGDYKLATLRFDFDYKESKELFNKGLAFLLAKDYANAIIYFEESIQMDRTFGYGFYGLAWIAATSGQDQLAIEHLGKAINYSEIIYQKALMDPIFEDVRKYSEFFKMFKKTSE